MTKLKAAGIHLLLSIFIVATVFAIMYFLWYPKGYFTIMGGKVLVALIGGVDIFLGPLLTFVVFKVGKKSLKFDLFCIGVMQVAALAYGTYVMFEARPVFTVFNKDKFQIAAVVDIVDYELAKAKSPQMRQLSITGPKLVAIGEPDKNNKKEVIFAMMESESAFRYPKLFDEYNAHKSEVIKTGKPLASLSALSSDNKLAIDQFISKSNRPETDFLYLPISSELAEMSAIVDAKTGDFIQIIDAQPEKPKQH
jgi:hypothetical protein